MLIQTKLFTHDLVGKLTCQYFNFIVDEVRAFADFDLPTFLLPKAKLRRFSTSNHSRGNLIVRTDRSGSQAVRGVEAEIREALSRSDLPAGFTTDVTGNSLLLNRGLYRDVERRTPELVEQLQAVPQSLEGERVGEALEATGELRTFHRKMAGFSLVRDLGMRRPGALADKSLRVFWNPGSSALLMEHVTRHGECRLYIICVAGDRLATHAISVDPEIGLLSIVDGSVALKRTGGILLKARTKGDAEKAMRIEHSQQLRAD